VRPIVISASKSTIRNETEYPITLQASATKNTIVSFGPVTDHGSDNTVKQIKQAPGDKRRQGYPYRIWLGS